MTDAVLKQLEIRKEDLEELKAAEVGNIFDFGTAKTTELDLYFTTEEGKKQPVHLGSYGIGITRLMGVIVEHFADDKGMVWPESVAPFHAHLLSLGADEKASEIYVALKAAGVEVLYDDRDVSAGEKFADSDLLGIPYRVVVGKRSLESGKAEVKRRTEKESVAVKFEKLAAFFQK